MPGTKKGGALARDTNRTRHGDDFYARIGAKGGAKKGVKKGFAADPARAARVGQIGGKNSKRGPAKIKVVEAEINATPQTKDQFDIAA